MLKRSFAATLVAASIVATAFAAPASAIETAGSVSVPAAGGCDKEYTVWWDTGKTPPVGSYGYIAC